jgi:hypothetical protein
MNGVKRIAALAAGLALGATVLFAAPASADGDRCVGADVKRCIRVQQSGDTYFAHAGIEDLQGEYQVRVSHIELQRWNGSSWVTVKSNSDADGWFNERDAGNTGTYGCTSGSGSFRAKAEFHWQGPRDGGEVMYTDKFAPC